MSILHPSPDVIYPPFMIPGSIFGISVGAAVITLYAIAIFGINNRKKFSVKLIRVLLILTMFSFPIGTVIGALLLRRINNPIIKFYFSCS
jgi:zinc transporter ZupT